MKRRFRGAYLHAGWEAGPARLCEEGEDEEGGKLPAGFGALLPFLEKDEALAQSSFKNLQLIFYAGAALPQDLWERLEAISIRTTGHRVPMTSAWGTTETSPLATSGRELSATDDPVITSPLTITGGEVIEYAPGSKGGMRSPCLRSTIPSRPKPAQG